MQRILFICSQNKLRSPTAEQVFAQEPGVEALSAGTNRDAEVPVSPELIEWADRIFVMEQTHRTKLQQRYRTLLDGNPSSAWAFPTTMRSWTRRWSRCSIGKCGRFWLEADIVAPRIRARRSSAFLSPMRISFDLDDTLIPGRLSSALEPLRFAGAAHAFGVERLRAGTRALFAALRERDHSVWIYSSSLRSRARVELLFRWHGLRVDGIVTFERHRQAMAARNLISPPTKFPPAFGIDLHVDDAEGVRLEGERHGFRVLMVAPDNREWVEGILAAVDGFAPSR